MFLVFCVLTSYDYENTIISVRYLGCGERPECEMIATVDAGKRYKFDGVLHEHKDLDDDVFLNYWTYIGSAYEGTRGAEVTYLIIDAEKKNTELIRDWM